MLDDWKARLREIQDKARAAWAARHKKLGDEDPPLWPPQGVPLDHPSWPKPREVKQAEARAKKDEAAAAKAAAAAEKATKRAERKAARAAKRRAAIGAGFADIPHRIRQAVFLATISAYGFLALFCFHYAGKLGLDVDWALGTQLAPKFAFNAQAATNVFPLVCILIVSVGILKWAKTWVSLFATTPRSRPVVKWGSFCLGVLSSIVIIMGTMSVNQDTKEGTFRGALDQQQQLGQVKAGKQADIAHLQKKLDTMKLGETYEAKAARAGAASWAEKIVTTRVQARTDADARLRLPRMERAVSDAQAADDLDQQIVAATRALAMEKTDASVVAKVEMNDPASEFVNAIGPWRLILLVLCMDLLLLIGPYFADVYEQILAEGGVTDAKAKQDDEEPAKDGAAGPGIGANKDQPEPEEPPLVLPPLADWREDEDPAFASRNIMVDETGRRMRRVGAHWRVDDRPAPVSGTDPRRAPEESAGEPIQPGPDAGPEPASEGPSDADLMNDIFGKEPAT